MGWLALAVLVHLGVLWWLNHMPVDAPGRNSTIKVQLVTSPAPVSPAELPPLVESVPEPVDKPIPPPIVVPEPEVQQELPPKPVRSEQRPPVTPQVTLEDPPSPTADELLNRLSRYRLDGESQLQPEELERAPPPMLGLANQTNMLAVMDRPLPELPFEPGEMGLNFYPAGVRGDIARGFDKITPEFGFVTSFGLEVKCKYVLILVTCGWRERL